jgi:glycerol-3-phosphate acyltransferase PlsY
LTPLPLIAVLVVFLMVVAWTRYISMGSIVGAATFPLGVWLISQPPWPVVAASVIAGGFIIYRHSSNIRRLHSGTENVFRFGASKP